MTVPLRAAAPIAGLGAGALLTGAVAGMVVSQSVAGGAKIALLLSAAVVGAGALWLALARFEVFLLGFLVVRPSLDALGSGGISPSQASGFLFLAAGGWWLLREHERQGLRPLAPGARAVLLLAGVGLLSSVASVVPSASAQAGLKVLGGALMFVVLGQLLGTRPQWAPWVVRSVLLSAVVPVGVAATQLGAPPRADATGSISRVEGTFVHPNPFATFLVVVVLVAVGWSGGTRWFDRLLRAGVGIPALVMIAGTGARAAWLGLVVGLLYLLIRRHPRLVLPVVAVVVTLALTTPVISQRLSDLNAPPPVRGAPANSLVWRWEYWHKLPRLAADRPITGIGLETVRLVMPEGLQPHSVWVQAYTELGVLGVLAVVTLVVSLGLELRARRRGAANATDRMYAEIGIAVALSLLVQSITENLLTLPAAYWYLAAACAYGLLPTTRQPLPEPAGVPPEPAPARPAPLRGVRSRAAANAYVVHLTRPEDR